MGPGRDSVTLVQSFLEFVELAAGGKMERIELTARSQTFSIAAEKAPATVELDPNTWLLFERR